MAEPTAPADPRPWRKRRPLLSRVVLFGAGAALVGGLLLLLAERREEERLMKLRGEVASFDLVLAVEGGPSEVLRLIEEKLSDAGLPRDLRLAARRYEAMALTHQAVAGSAGPGVRERIARAFEAALALAAGPEERNAILLERASGALSLGDPEAARAALAQGDFDRSAPWAVLRDHFRALAEAAELGPEAGARRLEGLLEAWEPPLPPRPRVSAGGRTWNLPQLATITTERLVRLYEELGRDPAPLWRRLSALVALDAREQVLCAKALAELGETNAARRAWALALQADPEEARSWAAQDPVLGNLHDSTGK